MVDRHRVVSVRFTEAEYQELLDRCKGNVSGYIRQMALNDPGHTITVLNEVIAFLTPEGRELVYGDRDGKMFYALVDSAYVDEQINDR